MFQEEESCICKQKLVMAIPLHCNWKFHQLKVDENDKNVLGNISPP